MTHFIVRTAGAEVWATPLSEQGVGLQIARLRVVRGADVPVTVEQYDPDYREWVEWSEDRLETVYDHAMREHRCVAGTETGTCVFCTDPMTERATRC